MINIKRKLKNFGPLEMLVIISFLYVFIMIIWTASTRAEVLKKASDIKSNHKIVVEFINDEINKCSQNVDSLTSWSENCSSVWTSPKIVKYILDNFKLNNPYDIQTRIALVKGRQLIITFIYLYSHNASSFDQSLLCNLKI